jgi:hypothetical protein
MDIFVKVFGGDRGIDLGGGDTMGHCKGKMADGWLGRVEGPVKDSARQR